MSDRLPIKVGVDQGVDLKTLPRLQDDGVVELYQAHDLEQSFRRVKSKGVPSVWINSNSMASTCWPETTSMGSKGSSGPRAEPNFEHVYAAHLNGNEYFITENPKDFINDERCETLENLLPPLKIRRVNEFLDELKALGVTPEDEV